MTTPEEFRRKFDRQWEYDHTHHHYKARAGKSYARQVWETVGMTLALALLWIAYHWGR